MSPLIVSTGTDVLCSRCDLLSAAPMLHGLPACFHGVLISTRTKTGAVLASGVTSGPCMGFPSNEMARSFGRLEEQQVGGSASKLAAALSAWRA